MGALFDKQNEFADDLCDFISHIRQTGLKKSLREVYRTKEQEDIYRKTGASMLPPDHPSDHEYGLAADLFICMPNGSITSDFDYLLPFGVFWESLNPANYWGGRWHNPYDPQHFGRKPSL